MDPAVHLRSAVCLLGRFPALAGVDLDVDRGEIVLLSGPNGAGKTTLLRALAGLVPVVRGDAVVLGHDLRRDRRSVRSHIGLLGHGAGLYDDLTVAENVRFWAGAHSRARSRASGGAAGTTPEEAMARLGLDGRLAGVPAGRLSAGQRRRAALAVLVARSPSLWLLDEPHAGLDATGRDVLDGVVAGAAAAGAAILLASHELERAATVAGRVVTLAGGQAVPRAAAATGRREPAHVA